MGSMEIKGLGTFEYSDDMYRAGLRLTEEDLRELIGEPAVVSGLDKTQLAAIVARRPRDPVLPRGQIDAHDLCYAASRRWGKAHALGCQPETMRLLEDLIDSAARYQASLTNAKAKHDG